MSKLIRQNVGGVDYTTVGCMLTGSCATAAADFVKDIVLSDGDSISDGITVACTFDYANTAGNSPSGQTVYSSDQITYYEDDQLTIPVTLAPSGCYTIEYTGTGNAYTYVCYPVLQIGNIKAPLKDSRGNILSGNIWQDGEKIMLTYTAGYFMRTGSGGDADIDFYETEDDVDAALAGMPDGQYATWPDQGGELAKPVDVVQSGNLHAITSNAVAEAFGEWVLFENITSGASVCKIYGKETLKEKYIHIHFEAFLNNTTYSIGNAITVIPEKWRPSETRRAVIACDLPNGRVGTGIDVYTNGSISLYPQIINQYTGNVALGGGFYGDATIIVSDF